MDTQKLIVDKITAVLDSTDKNQSAELKKLIDHAGHIFVAGAGRSKLVSSFLAMRLVHCGYNVSMVGEIVTPALKEGDLYIVISGSGGTKTLLPTLETAKSKGAKIAVVSMKASSAMADLADLTAFPTAARGSPLLLPPPPLLSLPPFLIFKTMFVRSMKRLSWCCWG